MSLAVVMIPLYLITAGFAGPEGVAEDAGASTT